MYNKRGLIYILINKDTETNTEKYNYIFILFILSLLSLTLI